MGDEPVMIDAPEVLAIEIHDCGEPLVDAASEGVRTAPTHPRVTSTAETRFWCRPAVLTRLVQADAALPDGVDLVLAEAHRPLELQRRFWEADLRALQAAHPGMSPEEVKVETAKFVAPPWIVPPHSTGGAVDVVLCNGEEELFMGCELNEQCEAMRTGYRHLDAESSRNRTLLLEAMQSVGFVNYGHEWWHYSYGDRYWASITQAEAAIFDGL